MNNATPNPAVGSEGATTPSPMLDELYKTLGSVQAGIETRQQEARTARTQALQAEQQLLADRQKAEDDQDPEAFDEATQALDNLKRVMDLIAHDLGGTDAAHEQPDGDSIGDRSDRDSDPAQPGNGPAPTPAAAGGNVRPDEHDAGDPDPDRG